MEPPLSQRAHGDGSTAAADCNGRHGDEPCRQAMPERQGGKPSPQGGEERRARIRRVFILSGDAFFALPTVRNLLILVLVIAGIWWIRRAMARIGKKPAKSRNGQADAAAERVLECAHCGLNVPESEGVREHGRFYCSDAHRLAGPRE